MTLPKGYRRGSGGGGGGGSSRGFIFALLLVLGMILLGIGYFGFTYSDPFSDWTIWAVLLGLGFVLIIVSFVVQLAARR